MSACRVLALNGSPRGGAGATALLLASLLEGMRDAGAETELIPIRTLRLEACTGCYSCWVHTPGRCVHRDGMDEALEAWSRADLVVFGTPVYHGSMTGLMKTFLDRLLPRYDPWLIPSPGAEGVTTHPSRLPEPRRMVLASVCGFPGFHNFDAIVHTFRHIARMHDMEVAGVVLRPFAEPLRLPALRPLFEDYFGTLRAAGRQLIESGAISCETKADLARDVIPGNVLQKREMANAHWRRLRAEAGIEDEAPATA